MGCIFVAVEVYGFLCRTSPRCMAVILPVPFEVCLQCTRFLCCEECGVTHRPFAERKDEFKSGSSPAEPH